MGKVPLYPSPLEALKLRGIPGRPRYQTRLLLVPEAGLCLAAHPNAGLQGYLAHKTTHTPLGIGLR